MPTGAHHTVLQDAHHLLPHAVYVNQVFCAVLIHFTLQVLLHRAVCDSQSALIDSCRFVVQSACVYAVLPTCCISVCMDYTEVKRIGIVSGCLATRAYQT